MFKRSATFLRRNLIGLIALAVALSGTAYAANTIGANDIKRNAVRSPHIRNGQVKRADLARYLQRRIYSSSTGADTLSVVKVDSGEYTIFAGQIDGTTAHCPPGYVVVGTGFFNGITEIGFVNNYGTYVGAGFLGTVIDATVEVQATCARTGRGGAVTSGAVDRSAFRSDLAALRDRG